MAKPDIESIKNELKTISNKELYSRYKSLEKYLDNVQDLILKECKQREIYIEIIKEVDNTLHKER